MHQFIVPPAWTSRFPVVAAGPLETKSAATNSRPVRCRAVLADPNPPGEPPVVPPAVACRIVRQLVLEIAAMAGERPLRRRDGRRSTCHVRQISMYVCHVVLSLSLSEIGAAFGRDRTTVGHACIVVEDRRDDAAFDCFIAIIERVVLSVFGPAGIGSHE